MSTETESCQDANFVITGASGACGCEIWAVYWSILDKIDLVITEPHHKMIALLFVPFYHLLFPIYQNDDWYVQYIKYMGICIKERT